MTETRTSPKRRSIELLNKKKKKHSKKLHGFLSISGVHNLKLSEEGQRQICCVAGVDLTTEDPWKLVLKEDFIYDLDINGEESEFFKLKNLIETYPEEKILVGFITDASQENEIFIFCLTIDAKEKVSVIIKEKHDQQQEKLLNAINKVCGLWESCGSEEQVEELMNLTNRPLYEIEVEGEYPVLRQNAHFKARNVEDSRDGYTEIVTTPEEKVRLTSIDRKLTHNHAQTYASDKSVEVQTQFRYCHNQSTQYGLDFFETCPMNEHITKRFKKFKEDRWDTFQSYLDTNTDINLYANEFQRLEDMGLTQMDNAEYCIRVAMNVLDVSRFTDKKVCHIAWHPVFAHIVAVSYTNRVPQAYLSTIDKRDVVLDSCFGVNEVALYSIDHSRRPALVLYSPRPVTQISFCAYDENILVGGLINGQVILWDIEGRLFKLEQGVVSLSAKQTEYRNLMNDLISSWMKDVYDPILIRPTALSDPKFSHKGCITNITYLDPFHKYNQYGKREDLTMSMPSHQFMTTGEDGHILLWSLTEKSKVLKDSFKPRKFRRLTKKPSSLMMDESIYKELHLNLRPIFKISVPGRFPGIMTQMVTPVCNVKYVHNNINVRKSMHSNFQREYFIPVMLEPPDEVTKLHVGTINGSYMKLGWVGRDFDSGEVINQELGVVHDSGCIHDGPVVSISYSKLLKVVMTTGGTIFALWDEDYKESPFFWRKHPEILSVGRFNASTETRCILISYSGKIYSWTLWLDSHKWANIIEIGNTEVTSSVINPMGDKEWVHAIGDMKGFLKIMNFKWNSNIKDKKNLDNSIKFVKNEVAARKAFAHWQASWNQTHTEIIEFKKALEKVESEVKIEQIVEEVPKKIEISMAEKMRQFWENYRKEKIEDTIWTRKHIDKKKLDSLKKPLHQVEEENMKVRQKLKDIYKSAEDIFQEAVKAYFPWYYIKVAKDIVDPYEDKHGETDKQKTFNNFLKISDSTDMFVKEHRSRYTFNWPILLTKNNNSRGTRQYHKRKSGESFTTFKSEVSSSSKTSISDKSENLSDN